MIIPNDSSGEPSQDAKRVFTEAFIRNAHLILLAGYRNLKAAQYSESEEDEITGDLAAEMNVVISNDPSPWMRSFQAHDQHPVTPPGKPTTDRRVGKRRWKIDLKFVANTGRGMIHFSWEAKRLGPRHAIGTYLGPKGLGCFLQGQYSRDCDFGGMLGYAQSGSEAEWHGKLAERIPGMDSKDVLATKSRLSKHERPDVGRHISIYHTILRFN